MYELVYTSLAAPGLSKLDIENILLTSNKNNKTKGITGCLLYYKREFLQILEGPKKELKNLFESIQKDTRNLNPKILYEGEIEKPIFDLWYMAIRDLNSEDVAGISDLLKLDEFISLQDLIKDNKNAGKILFNYIATNMLDRS